ncbi:hypothetical protein TNIN_171701 [Trichonephila inaurata madagascariensis]|uniref:Uncharacterized protein n=1 Tax=Trichonephila inaurata madagascariensis TaxID=2747483 RepID=A0A8X6X8S0_9ARAC|nr:hypothetical protein TNIN_171701 [Trichonephila inaurata madagascariensis]
MGEAHHYNVCVDFAEALPIARPPSGGEFAYYRLFGGSSDNTFVVHVNGYSYLTEHCLQQSFPSKKKDGEPQGARMQNIRNLK